LTKMSGESAGIGENADADTGWVSRIADMLRLSGPTKEKFLLARKRGKNLWTVYKSSKTGMIGLVMLLIVLGMAAFADSITPYGPFEPTGAPHETPPSPRNWLGTDLSGWDIFSRVIYGSRVSLMIGLVATAVSMGLGTLVGLMSGYWGGWRDEVLMRITDVFLVIPWLVLMIVLAYVLPGGASVTKVVFVIGITGWSSTARIVRAQVFSLKERAFVERARAIGSGDWHIVRRHIFPNVFPLIFANAILTIALSILSESTLSYVNLGPRSYEVVTWGNILNDAVQAHAMTLGYYWWIVVPGLCIVFVVLAFTFIGFALDEIFNPKLRRR